jgi:hypothetical protein
LEYEDEHRELDMEGIKHMIQSTIRFKANNKKLITEQFSDPKYLGILMNEISNGDKGLVTAVLDDAVRFGVGIPTSILEYAILNSKHGKYFIEKYDRYTSDVEYIVEKANEVNGILNDKPFYERWIQLGLTDKDLRPLRNFLWNNIDKPQERKHNPCEPSPCWKTRWPYGNEGSEGGLRIISAYFPKYKKIIIIFCYPKNGKYGKEKLTKGDIKWIRDRINKINKEGVEITR